MGIYSRDYYKDEHSHYRDDYKSWSGWQILIAITVAVFLMQIMSFSRFNDPRSVTYWLSLKSDQVFQGQIWRLVTYIFCHDIQNIWHILFNMLGLWFFGKTVEYRMHKTEFIAFYITAGVIAGLFEILLAALTTHRSNTVGASGSVMGIMILYAYWFPYATLYIYFFPIQARTLAIFVVGVDAYYLLTQFMQVNPLSGVAHACHLGGAAFGLIYGHYHLYLTGYFANRKWTSRVPRRSRPSIFSKKPDLKFYDPEDDVDDAPIEKVPEPKPTDAQFNARLDDILQKILEHGEASLSQEDRDFMQEASRRLQKKNQ